MVLHKWTLPLLLILLPGCSKSETKQMLTIHGHTFQAELIRTPSASRKFLSWNTLSRDSAFVVRFTPPRHHFYDSHQNKFEILFLDPEGKILEIARLEATHDSAVTSKSKAEWAVFLLPGIVKEIEIKEGDVVTLSESLREEKPELLSDISINGNPLRAEVARTPAERSHGLMHRKKLSPDDAMIFLHEKSSPEEYWMGNVYIDLDIAFFRADRTLINVVEMKQYPNPKTDKTPTAQPGEKARYVVETNLGWFREKGLTGEKGLPKGTVRLELPKKLR